jgi:hypothetical protein
LILDGFLAALAARSVEAAKKISEKILKMNANYSTLILFEEQHNGLPKKNRMGTVEPKLPLVIHMYIAAVDIVAHNAALAVATVATALAAEAALAVATA